MPSPIECSKVRFAIAAVREAAQLVRRVQSELVVASSGNGELAKGALAKDDKSPVTVADFAAQAIVGRRLSETFPEMGFVGEESADALRTDAGRATLEQITHFVRLLEPEATFRQVCDWIDLGAGQPTKEFWALDPVDGTKGFLRGDQYAVALGYIRDGVVRVGALACPELSCAELGCAELGRAESGRAPTGGAALGGPRSAAAAPPEQGGSGSLLVARRGDGTWAGMLDDEAAAWSQLAVSRRATPREARLLCSVEKDHTDPGGIGLLVRTLKIMAAPVPMDSQAKYAVLASGGGEVNLRLISPKIPDYRERIWDQAAGSIIIEEAGGRVSDLDGKPLDFSQGRTLAANRGVLATNGHLHADLLAGLREIHA